MSTGYWGPQIKVGVPQPALNVAMEAHTNVESMQLGFDSEHKKLPILYIQEPNSKAPIPIPIPDITPLNPPLGLVPSIPKATFPITETAKLNPLQAAVIGLAKASQMSDAVSATGSLDV